MLSHWATCSNDDGSDDANSEDRLEISDLDGDDTGKAFDMKEATSRDSGVADDLVMGTVSPWLANEDRVGIEWTMPRAPVKVACASASPVNDCSTSCLKPCIRKESEEPDAARSDPRSALARDEPLPGNGGEAPWSPPLTVDFRL